MPLSRAPTTKLVILDRDGVINYDSSDYIKSPEEWRPLPGSLEAIALLNQAGYKVAIASNQSGVARGLFSLETLQAIHQKLAASLKPLGGCIDFIACCPHHPDENCPCRKPRPGLLLTIASHYNCRLQNVPVIGDSYRDLAAALAVCAQPILVLTGNGEKTLTQIKPEQGVKVYVDLLAAAKALCEGSKE